MFDIESINGENSSSVQEIKVNETGETPIKNGSKKKIWRIVIIAIIIFLLTAFSIVVAIILDYKFNGEDMISTGKGTFVPFEIDFTFADYNLDNTDFTPSIPAYEIDYTKLTNLQDFESDIGVQFSGDQKESLDKDHFFISTNLDEFYSQDLSEDASREDDWTFLYGDIGGGGISVRKPENAPFVTSDFLLHVYHRLLEKHFEYIEETQLYPRLKTITDKILDEAIIEYAFLEDNDTKESYERIMAYFSVPKVILDSAYDEYSNDKVEDLSVDSDENIISELDDLCVRIPNASCSLAKEELTLLLEKSDQVGSPIFGDLQSQEELGFLEDYSQYTPRSHYNKNSVLRSYFRAMMWYGRNNFFLESDGLTMDAIHIVMLLWASEQIENWEDIYITTTFLVGRSDDLGIEEYSQAIGNYGYENGIHASESLISQVREELESMDGPQIMSSLALGDTIFDLSKDELQEKTKGFRFMGQRFTPDAFVFSTITQGDETTDEETGEKLPSSTTALAVMSSLGFETADLLLEDWITENASQSRNVLENRLNYLRDYFESTSEDIWTQNIYWSWLYTLESVPTQSLNKTGYPGFMKNDSWDYKSLQCVLGSWTELKHDTLLYAKQSYAEMGSGGGEDIPPVPKGYMESNIPFLDKLVALSEMTYNGFEGMGLMDNEFEWRYESFLEALRFFREVAVQQIQNETISDEDFERLRLEAGELQGILYPLPGEMYTENDVRSALIADVYTDGRNGEILYEANGIPNYIYVAVNDVNGIRLTKGLVFSYYEFTGPLGERLSDEDWRELNYTDDKSNLPSSPEWVTSIMSDFE